MNASLVSGAKRWLRRAAFASLVVGAPAHAATYSGVWDPPYGSPFGNATSGLGWRGAAHYFVPDSCVPAGTTQVDNFGILPGIPGNCGGQAVVTDAQVELYNVATSGQPTLATLNFDAASMDVLALNYVGGELAGLATTVSDFLNPPENLTSVNVPGWASFGLYFEYTGPRLAWGICSSNDYTAAASTHYYEHDACVILGVNSNYGAFRPEFVISRVPEPGTLALASLALLALPAVRRRAAALLDR